MDLKAIIGLVLQVISVLSPNAEPTSGIAKITALLTALQNSPSLLAWLQTLITKQPATVPPGTLPEFDADELKAAFEGSPEVKAWAAQHKPVPEGAEAIGLSDLQTFLQLLPQLIALFNLFKKPATT